MRPGWSDSLVLAGGLLLAAGPARAQEPDTLRFTGDVGVVNTAGNTDLTTVNVGQKLEWRRGRLLLAESFAVVYGRSEGETTSSLWRGSLRGDVRMSPAVAAYASAGYERNRFAGISRRLEEGAGVAFGLLRRTRDRLDLEGGVLLVQERPVVGADNKYLSARGAGRYVHQFSDRASLQQWVEVASNLEAGRDVRLNTETALVAPLSQRLALKVGYVIRFDNQPEPGFGKTDRILTTGLQFTL